MRNTQVGGLRAIETWKPPVAAPLSCDHTTLTQAVQIKSQICPCIIDLQLSEGWGRFLISSSMVNMSLNRSVSSESRAEIAATWLLSIQFFRAYYLPASSDELLFDQRGYRRLMFHSFWSVTRCLLIPTEILQSCMYLPWRLQISSAIPDLLPLRRLSNVNITIWAVWGSLDDGVRRHFSSQFSPIEYTIISGEYKRFDGQNWNSGGDRLDGKVFILALKSSLSHIVKCINSLQFAFGYESDGIEEPHAGFCY